MAAATLARAPVVQPRMPSPAGPAQDARMYAIAFDMDTDTLERAYPGPSWKNAYTEIQRVLTRHGFTR
ncbi:MAG: hypothetical protein ACRC7O_05270, partial [Fimbriiglobus sp.]